MKTRAVITLGLSALALGGTVVGCTTGKGGIASASTRSEARAEKQAASLAAQARTALAKGKADIAVTHAEAATSLAPQVAAHRMLLGQTYLKAGRFGSARQAFADAITLEPGNGKAALNLALAEIAGGDWAGARRTLDTNASVIPASDRGLAMALAGDPVAAVELLSGAARAPDADAKTRQNLALALALAGRWQEAKTVVEIDVAPGEVNQRIMQWAEFARPKSASDQVAALLGVVPVRDPGQPVALALNLSNAPAMASVDPIENYMPGTPANAMAVAADMGTPVGAPVAAPAVAEVAVMAAPVSNVSFGTRQEVVQRLPARAVAKPAAAPAAPGVFRSRLSGRGAPTPAPLVSRPISAMPAAVTKGNFFVQLGAFPNAAVARDAWGRIAQRNPGFAQHTPSGMGITSKGESFYRLSVGGFARVDAVALCSGYKAKGGNCFVRAGAGDRVVAWAKGATKLASR